MKLSFKTFITEGGKYRALDSNTGQMVGSTPLSVDPSSPDYRSRSDRQADLRELLHHINQHHFQQTGHHIFGENGAAIDDNSAFAGSTHHYMNPNISDNDLINIGKTEFGDFDTQFAGQHSDSLNKILRTGAKFGKYTVVDTKPQKDQNIALLKHEDGKYQQVDFGSSDYEGNKPSLFYRSSKSSPYEDLRHGIKGAFGKILNRAIAHGQGQTGIVRNKKGDKETFVPKTSFSIGLGLRPSHEQIGTENGKPVFKELTSKTATYTRDVPTIYRTMYGAEPTPEDINNFGSFHGGISSAQRHFSPEQQSRVVDRYVHNIYDPGSQVIGMTHDKDQQMKDLTINHLRNAFPHHFTPEKEQEIADKRTSFYEKQRNKPPREE